MEEVAHTQARVLYQQIDVGMPPLDTILEFGEEMGHHKIMLKNYTPKPVQTK